MCVCVVRDGGGGVCVGGGGETPIGEVGCNLCVRI